MNVAIPNLITSSYPNDAVDAGYRTTAPHGRPVARGFAAAGEDGDDGAGGHLAPEPLVDDDVTDEAVFRRARAPWLTVRIGRDDPRSAAMFGLDSETELVTVLARLAALPPPLP